MTVIFFLKLKRQLWPIQYYLKVLIDFSQKFKSEPQISKYWYILNLHHVERSGRDEVEDGSLEGSD